MFDAVAGAARAARRPRPTAAAAARRAGAARPRRHRQRRRARHGRRRHRRRRRSPTVAGPFMPVPVVVHKGYRMPDVRRRRARSCSPSRSRATPRRPSRRRPRPRSTPARRVVVRQPRAARWPSSADAWGAPHVRVARRHPRCRAPRIGALAVPPLRRARADGLFPGAAALDRRRRRAARAPPRPARSPTDNPARRAGPAHRPARSRSSTAAAASAALAAERWKTQFNENAKVAGVRQPGARARPQRDLRLGPARRRHPPGVPLVQLRHDFEHPQVAARFDARRRAARRGRRRGIARGARPRATGTLAQLLDLVLPRRLRPACTSPPRTTSTPARSPILADIEGRVWRR